MSKPLVAVTGASSGIGLQCVKDFAARGYPVLALARRVEKMQQELSGLSNVLVEKVDVTNMKQMEEAIAKAEKQFNTKVDLMINNAGVMYLEIFENEDLERVNTMVATNVLGVLNGCKVVLKDMISRKTGTIMNVSSIAGKKAFSKHTAYCGTKFFVHGFTEALREEVSGSNVRVICIAPGVVETELLSHNQEHVVKPYQQWKETMDKVLDAVDVSKTIMFAYELPQHVCLREIAMAATQQSS